jgi:hypothetical protein
MNITCKYNGELSFIIQNKYDYLLVNGKIKKDDLVCIKITKPRKVKHNSKYWVLLDALSFHTGDSQTDLHEYFKKTFIITEKHYNKLGFEVEVYKSTSFENMDQIEFETYYNKIDNWLLEKGIIIEDLINSMPK